LAYWSLKLNSSAYVIMLGWSATCLKSGFSTKGLTSRSTRVLVRLICTQGREAKWELLHLLLRKGERRWCTHCWHAWIRNGCCFVFCTSQ
jgi:hypothetical protein